jgi:hypothetical protein
MPNDEPMDVIASRILEVDGEPKFHVRIGRPKPAPEGDCWFCPYEIAGPLTNRKGRFGGEDGMQALVLTLNILSVEIEISEENAQGRLSWLGSKEFGLPSPPVIQPDEGAASAGRRGGD